MNATYRTDHEATVEYFREHPERILPFLDVCFEESTEDGDWASLVSALDIVVEANDSGPKKSAKTLSGKTKPHLDTISAILNQLGLRLSVVPIGETESKSARAKKNNRARTQAHNNSAAVSEKQASYNRSKKPPAKKK